MKISIIVVVICILISAFFSGMEIAYISTNKLKLELNLKQKTLTSRILNRLYKNPSQYLTTLLIGNNISLVIFAIFSSKLLYNLIELKLNVSIPIYLVTIVHIVLASTLLLLAAEFIPRVLFSINPNKVLTGFAFPVMFIYILFYPITKATLYISNFIIRNIFKDKTHPPKNNFAFGKVDLDALIDEENIDDNTEDETTIDSQDIKIFKNVLDFSDVKIKECLIPRTEIAAIEITDTVENLKQLFIETGYARIIIYNESIDNIIGYVHSSVLFRKPKSIKNIVAEVPIVPESMHAQKVLHRLNEENKGIAVVVDEFGGTVGIVTQEDIMEEIFGEIEDEHDRKDLIEKQINEFEYIFSGRQEIDYLNEKFSLELPNEDDYETIAGLILHTKEDIPNINEIIKISSLYKFKILEVSNTRIEKVQLYISHK